MEEKQGIKISLSTFFLIIALIVIAIMAFFMYKTYSDNQNANNKIIELDSQTNNLQATTDKLQEMQIDSDKDKEENNKNDISQKNETENNNISFSKLMNMIYPISVEKNSIKYSANFVEVLDYSTTLDISNNLDIQACSISATKEDNKIGIRICDTEKSVDKYFTITGIIGEVVSIKMLTFETKAIPSSIYCLTRDGDVYYATNNSDITAFSNLKANKINNISNVVSIHSVGAFDNTLPEPSYGTVTATLYNGEYIILSEYTK